MSYALEVKKRKFERILDSLTDSSTSTAPSSSTIQKIPASTTPSASTSSASSKRRRITPIGKVLKLPNPSTASLTAHYLPSSRLAFLERLESFRQVTQWHIPSTSRVNAVEWAKRGWVCEDTDTVLCPTCKERLHVDVDLQAAVSPTTEAEGDKQGEDEDDPSALATSLLENLTQKYHEFVVSAHAISCPWRKRGCDGSIQRIEGLLNTSNTIVGLDTRYKGILEDAMEVPSVVSLPAYESYGLDENELTSFTHREQPSSDLNALRLSICGWQKKETDVVECRNCFRSLGLWLYRGPQPTMEHLDAIDSHLEYCPWRSAASQDTELSFSQLSSKSKDHVKEKVPGWMLVFLAIVKDNNKRRASNPQRSPHRPIKHSDHPVDDDDDEEEAQAHISPEQREKKMKELMKRIRDLKKPFNVKSLLRRKEKQ